MKIEIVHTEVNTFDTCVCYDVLKSLRELQVYVVENSSHQLSQPLTPNGKFDWFGQKKSGEPYRYSSRNL